MLYIKLVDNPLTKDDPNDCRAMVVNYKKKKMIQIVKQIAVPGSILKETECEAVIKRFLQILAGNLHEGIGFESEYMVIAQGVNGVFANNQAPFDRSRHEVTMLARAGEEFQKALDSVEVVIVDHIKPKPMIKSTFDTKSKSDEKITADRLLDIDGDLLKIEDETDPTQGVFLVSTQKEKEMRVDYIHYNSPKKLQVEIPATLKTGEKYRLEVRSRVYGGKELRASSYDKVLTVA